MRRARDILQSPSGPDRGESHEIRTQRICYRYTAWGGSSGAHIYTGVKKEDREEESSAEVSRIYTIRKPTIIDLFEDAGKNREKRGHR